MGKFNPNGIAPLIANGSIRTLVQTVLPTVYDDSLSYFEVLGKVIKAVNTDTENVNTLAENQTKFFNDLTEFVNENVYAEVYTIDWGGSSQLSNEVGAKLEEFITNNGIARVHFTGDNPYYAYLYNTVNVSDNPINKRYWFASILMTDIDKASIKTVRVEHTQTGFYITSDTINFASEGYVNSSVLNAITYIESEINANSVVRVEFHVTKENGVYTYNSANKTPEELKTLMGRNDGKTPIEYYAIVADKDITIPSTPPETGGDWNEPTEIYMRPRVSRSKTYVNDVYYDFILVSFTINEDKHNTEVLRFSNDNDTVWSFYHGFIEHFETLSINARDTNGVISNIYSPTSVEGWYNAVYEHTSKRSPIVVELTLLYGAPSSKYISADIRTSEIYAAHTSTDKTVVVKFRAEGKTYTFTGNAINNTWEAITSGGTTVIDNTLSVSGAAADAKVTGDKFDDLKSALNSLNETASVTSTGTGDYFVNYPISAGDRIKAVSTAGVNIHTRATQTGANIEELGYVNAAGSPKIFTATADASWFKMYFTGAGTITFENLSKRVPILEANMTEVEQDISDFKITFDEAITSNVNYLEQTNVDNNYIWSRNNGNKSANQHGEAYDAIPIKNGKTYYFRNIYAYFSLIKKSDGTFAPITDDTSASYSGTYTADDDGYACITISNDPNYSTGCLFTDSEQMYDDANPYSYFEPNKLQVGSKVFNVGSTREYTRLRDGITEAIKYKNSIVYVDAGTYDLCTEFASEITANQSGVKFGIGLGNGVHVLFDGGAKVVANYTGGVQNITSYFNPFYPVDDGCFTLENADISVKNTRYCVHDEWSGHTKARLVKYINCKMVMDNTSAVINWYPQCIGGGNGASDYISIENCYFKSKVSETASAPLVSYHNNNSGTGDMKSDVHVSNCYFADKGTFRCSYSGAATAVSRAYVNNCSLGSALIIGQETSGGTAPENYELIPWMNELRSA